MTDNEKKTVIITAGVLFLLWLLKRGGLGFGLVAGPLTAGAAATPSSIGGAVSIGSGTGGSTPATSSGGGCCGCGSPAGGPITGNFGNYAQGGTTLRVPVSWIDDPLGSTYPGWMNVNVPNNSVVGV